MEHSKEDYYLAQIAAEVRRGIVKNPKKVRVKDFLLMDKAEADSNSDPLKTSKAFWLSSLRVNTNTPGTGREAGRRQIPQVLG